MGRERWREEGEREGGRGRGRVGGRRECEREGGDAGSSVCVCGCTGPWAHQEI
jgi:hypothetical protein